MWQNAAFNAQWNRNDVNNPIKMKNLSRVNTNNLSTYRLSKETAFQYSDS